MAWTNNGGNDQLYADPVNGGIGFGNWSSSKTGFDDSGFNLGDSTAGGGGNINVGTYSNAFTVFGHTATNATAIRPIADVLSEEGDFLTFKFNINFRNGTKGIRLLNNSGTTVYAFQATSGPDRYEDYTVSGGFVNLGWPYVSNGVYTLTLSRGASNTLVSTSRTVDIQSQSRLISDTVASIQFFCQNTDNDLASNNLYFNSLSTVNPYRA